MTGCIYHEADLDGVMSAAIVKKYFKWDIDLLPYNYGKEIPDVNKIENNPDTSGFIISSDKCVINGFKAEKNDGDERSILLHIGILSPFNDDPVIIIKQEGI